MDDQTKNELFMMRIFALLVIILFFFQRIQIDSLTEIVQEHEKSIQSLQHKLKD